MDERRQYERYELGLTGKFSNAHHRKDACKISDVSWGGLCLDMNLRERALTGSLFIVEIEIPDRNVPIKCFMQLKWLRETPERKNYQYRGGGEAVMIDPSDHDYLIAYASQNKGGGAFKRLSKLFML